MTNEEWQNHEIRKRINEGTATDEDFDTLAKDSSFNRDWLGDKGKEYYDAAVSRLPQIDKSNNPQIMPQDTHFPNGNATEDTIKDLEYNREVNPGMKEKDVRDLDYTGPLGNFAGGITKDQTEEEYRDESNARREQLRRMYANDNEGYKKALEQEGIDNISGKGKIRSIQEAYYSGDIDKSTRDYMMADVLAKFARNTGRDIGNIGAQFTGGTIDSNREENVWDTRNKELFGNAITAEKAAQEGSEAEMKRKQDTANLTTTNLGNEKIDRSLGGARLMGSYKNAARSMAEELRKKGENSKAAIMDTVAGEYALLESASTSSVDTEEHVANVLAGIGRAVASGMISDEDAAKMKEDIQGFAKAGGPTINVGIGGGSSKDKVDIDSTGQKGIRESFWDNAFSGGKFNGPHETEAMNIGYQIANALGQNGEDGKTALKSYDDFWKWGVKNGYFKGGAMDGPGRYDTEQLKKAAEAYVNSNK